MNPFDSLEEEGRNWHLEDHGIDLKYDADFLPKEDADRLFAALHQSLSWHRPVFHMPQGKFPAPRRIAWHADEGLSYRYSGIVHPWADWTEGLAEIRDRVKDVTGVRFNGVLANLYEDENDSVSFHADDESDLVEGSPIASVSLGYVRTFAIRHMLRKNRHNIPLGHGSLLVMAGATQRVSQHSIPKCKGTPCGPRINLTFRRIVVPALTTSQ